MRRLFSTVPVAAMAARGCATLNVAPKKQKSSKLGAAQAAQQMAQQVEGAEKAIPKATEVTEGAVKGELSTAEIEKHMEEWSKMTPEELDKLYKKFEDQESQENRILAEDSLYQMDVSLKSKHTGGTKVFWKNVDVQPYLTDKGYQGWYTVTVDGRKIKAFESKSVLSFPSESYAVAVAKEWSEQTNVLNKLNMPLTDLASGAQHVAPQAIGSRIDYLMAFFNNDNCYFRSEAIQESQDKNLAPVFDWFQRSFDVELPRIVGIGHPNIPTPMTNKIRDALYAMEMNPYQIVALCVVAQFTSSLILPLAMFNRIIDVETALKINRAEENHNISTQGEIKGYHDIREADLVVKICASAVAWRSFHDVPLAKCCEIPREVEEDDLA